MAFKVCMHLYLAMGEFVVGHFQFSHFCEWMQKKQLQTFSALNCCWRISKEKENWKLETKIKNTKIEIVYRKASAKYF